MPTARLLVGPADPAFADRFLTEPDTRAFPPGPGPADWAGVAATLPPGWAPDAVLVRTAYVSVPAWVWGCPAPVVALAQDPNLLWHGYRELLPLFDLVLTDAPAADRLRRAGLAHVSPACLYGLDRHFLAEIDAPEGERDVDVAFVGNLSPEVQGGRLPWLGRVARLADRFRVVVAGGVFGADYRALLRRAKLCFNRSIRGECNQRAFEAAACGAVLLQEADNAEVPLYLAPDAEYLPYTADDLEAVVAGVLADGPARRAVAARARERARGSGWLDLIRAALAGCAGKWDAVKDRAAGRAADPPRPSLSARVWQRASLAGPDADPGLAPDLRAAGREHDLALLAPSPAAAAPHLAAAAAGNRVSAAGLASALVDLRRGPEAVGVLRGLLADLDAGPGLTEEERGSCPYPVRFDHVRVGWDRAGWDHPGDPAAGDADKAALLRCRAAALLAELTGDLAAFEAAAAARPDLPPARAALGCALARAGRFAAAVDHLHAAVAGNPFDAAAADALAAALADAGRPDEAAAARADRRLLARAAPGPVARPGAPPAPARRTRVVAVPPAAFAARFGDPDTSAALCGFTPARDTHAVLALVAHLRPRRVLEVGTAAGHMTANLCRWTPPDARVFTLGVVRGDRPASGAAEQEYEVPSRAEFARHADHFGTAHKALFVTADSRAYDFARLAPLDFAFVDGGHDFETVRSDSAGAYAALRPGGCLAWHDFGSRVPWVKVREAVEALAFGEPVHHVAGTEVAYLFKGDGAGAAAGPDAPRVALAWDGEFEEVHSLAAVNRAACAELAARGHALALVPSPTRTAVASRVGLPPALAARLGRPAGPADAYVRHRWPPDFTPPAGPAPFVLCQPWEYGRVPRAWVGPVLAAVDEVWAYSRAVEQAFVASGVPADRVRVVPLGVDPDRFRPGLNPLPLATRKGVKLLFVGGTIPRKGFDLLLAAYRRAFTAADDVCLVVRDLGAGTFYRGQTAEGEVARHRADPAAPEVEYLAADLSEGELPRLYAACDALAHPYRGEGFGLPVLEAMACGLPVVVTAGGPTDEFVPPAACWRIPSRVAYFPEDRVGEWETAGRPWWLEPDPDALAEILRAAVADAAGRRERGAAGRRAALGWTWARTAAAVEDRARDLRGRTPVRFRTRGHPAPASPPAADTPAAVPAAPRDRPRVSLTMIVRNEEHNLPACLGPVRGLFDEVVVVDTGSADRTREVARGLGARVSEFPWVDDFAAARNAALDAAAGEWAFWLDADDRVDDDNRRKLAALLGSLPDGNAAFVVKCVCAADGPGGAETAVDHVRLFRRDPRHRWDYRVHEQILPALRRTGADVRWSGVAVRHVGYVDPAVRRRKLDRDLRLLRLEEADRPGDPFVLFNLGSIHHELGDWPAAAAALAESLRRSHPKDSIVRKAYALLAQCRKKAGDRAAALAACREGRGHYPDDAELLFVEGNLRHEAGDRAGAEDAFLRLIRGREGDHFASVDTGLRGHKARHNLAILYRDGGRPAEAEAQWRMALVDEPGFVPAHLGLGELALRAKDWVGVDRVAGDLRGLGAGGEVEAEVLLARAEVERRAFAAACARLEAALDRFPDALPLRVTLTHALLKSGADPAATEAALRDVLVRDPHHTQARQNLEVLLRNQGRWVEGVIDGTEPVPPPA